MPASQLDLYRVEDLDQFLNQRLKVQVIEINPRLTTSYVGLRALASCNLAAALLNVVAGQKPRLTWRDHHTVRWTAGNVWLEQ